MFVYQPWKSNLQQYQIHMRTPYQSQKGEVKTKVYFTDSWFHHRKWTRLPFNSCQCNKFGIQYLFSHAFQRATRAFRSFTISTRSIHHHNPILLVFSNLPMDSANPVQKSCSDHTLLRHFSRILDLTPRNLGRFQFRTSYLDRFQFVFMTLGRPHDFSHVEILHYPTCRPVNASFLWRKIFEICKMSLVLDI